MYKVITDMVLDTNATHSELEIAILEAIVQVVEEYGGQVAGSVQVMPVTTEELEAEVDEVLRERQAASVQ